jgi:hypothetical protein
VEFVLTLHGEIRWLVVLVAAAVAVRSLWGWLGRSAFAGADRALMVVFTTLLDLNLLLGVILLFALPGGFPAFRLEHAVTMILAVATAHSWAIWRRSDDDARKFRNNFFVALAVVVLVVVGVVRLRGGWMF